MNSRRVLLDLICTVRQDRQINYFSSWSFHIFHSPIVLTLAAAHTTRHVRVIFYDIDSSAIITGEYFLKYQEQISPQREIASHQISKKIQARTTRRNTIIQRNIYIYLVLYLCKICVSKSKEFLFYYEYIKNKGTRFLLDIWIILSKLIYWHSNINTFSAQRH